MEEMEQKLNSILGNPEMMAQIMSMAQAFGQTQGDQKKQDSSQQKNAPPPPAPKMPSLPTGMDLAMLQKVAGIAQQSNIDRNQQALIKALSPYLSKDRIVKLEKAMRAAKIASFASTALSSSGSSFQLGR